MREKKVGMRENRLRMIQRVQELALAHYELGRLDRCYAEVWRRYVYPVYPICYDTFLRYMAVDVAEEASRVEVAKSKPDKYRGQALFDF